MGVGIRGRKIIKRIWIIASGIFCLAIALMLGAPAIPLNVQNGSDKAAKATADKSTTATAARIERIGSGIEPVETGKGEAAIPLDIEKLMKLYDVPGFSVAVIEDYKIAWVKSYGVTEPGGKNPVTSRTLFQAGSISKPVAAAGMLALVQQGKLALDEDVNVKLKSWKVPENELTKEQKVTLRRLASHSAGLTVHGFPGYDVDEKVRRWCRFSTGRSLRIPQRSAWILCRARTSAIPAAESPSSSS